MDDKPKSESPKAESPKAESVVVRFFRFVFVTAPVALLGRWTPPNWLRFLAGITVDGIGSFVGSPIGRPIRWMQAHKVATVLLAVAGLGAYGGWQVYGAYETTKPGLPPFVDVNPGSIQLTPLDGRNQPRPLDVQLSRSAAPLELVGKEVTAGIALTPKLPGTWKWVTDRHLRFEPFEDWRIDTAYQLTFDRAAFSDQVRVTEEDLEHEVRSPPFSFSISKSSFYQDPGDPKVKKMVATVRFSHLVDRQSFEKHITIDRVTPRPGAIPDEKEPLGFSVRYSDHGEEAFIHSNVVDIPKDDQKLELNIREGVKATRASNEGPARQASVTVPGIYTFFKLGSVSVRWVDGVDDKPRLVLLVNTTDGVEVDQIEEHLDVVVLPRHKPRQEGNAKITNYSWSGAEARVTPTDRKAGRRLDLKADPAARRFVKRHSFALSDVRPGQWLHVRLKKGLKSEGGYELPENALRNAHVPKLGVRLSIQHEGGLLSLQGEKAFGIVSRGLGRIDLSIKRILPTEVNHLVTQTSGDLSNLRFNNYNFGFDNVAEGFKARRTLTMEDPTQPQYSSFDLTEYLERRSGLNAGIFFVELNGRRPNERHSSVSTSRVVLVTDLGLITKRGKKGGLDVFVQSLRSGRPVAGADVRILGKNGLSVARATTGSDGHVFFKPFTASGPKQPIAVLARKGADQSFIPWSRAARRLDLSRFDVGGTTGRSADGLTAYMFSDRGIYRPGEDLIFAAIVRSRDWERDVRGLTVHAEIRDVKNRIVLKERRRLDSTGLLELKASTRATSPTGTYSATIHLVDRKGRRSTLLGSTTARVEEFLPDRMKIRARLSKSRRSGWVKPEDLSATVTLENLFGAPATDRRVEARYRLDPRSPYFPTHPDHRFHVPVEAHARRPFVQRLTNQTTDDQGQTTFELDLSHATAGIWKLTFDAQGYEAGSGRSVGTAASTLVSHREFLVGLKADGNLGYIKRNAERNVNFLAVDESLAAVAVDGLRLRLEEERYVSVLTERRDGTLAYQSERRIVKLEDGDLSIAAKTGSNLRLKTDQAGTFRVTVLDKQGSVLSSLTYEVAGKANLTRQMEKGAELDVKLARSDYDVGDQVEVRIKAPYRGAGLITIERDEVYAYKWFVADTKSSVQTIRVPGDIENNAYVHVTVLRASDSREVFTRPFSYGVVPFTLSKQKRTVAIDVDRPARARPGEDLVIKVKTDRPATGFVFGVDEGILQVASYETPDPLRHFLTKRALEVRSWQILDLVLPDASLSNEVAASGGDYDDEGEAKEALGQNLNPFRREQKAPVAFWSGRVDLGPDGTEHRFRLPDDFNGAMRVMVVAAAPGSMGSTSSDVHVRGDLILSANAPLFAAPTDRFQVTVGVSNQIEGLDGKEATVEVVARPSPHVKISSAPKVELTIGERREKTATFEVEALHKLGGAHIDFEARVVGKLPAGASAEPGRARATLSVRPASPYLTTVWTGALEKDAAHVELDRVLYPHLRTGELALGSVPISVARGLHRYVQAFPYGCSEQIVSKAMAGMMLHDLDGLGVARDTAEASFQNAQRLLRFRQNGDGSFGMWTQGPFVRPHHTIYAAHFFLEAKERGWPVDQAMLNNALGYVDGLIKKEPKSLNEARLYAYGAYVLARSGRVVTSSLDKLADVTSRAWPKRYKKDLFSAYAATTYRLLKKEKVADRYVSGLGFGYGDSLFSYFSDELASDSQTLYLVAEHFPEKVPDVVTAASIKTLMKPLERQGYNTLSSAYLILALRAYVDQIGGLSQKKAEGSVLPFVLMGAPGLAGIDGGGPAVTAREVHVPDPKGKGVRASLSEARPGRALDLGPGSFPTVEYSDQARGLDVVSKLETPLFYQVTHAGFDKTPPKKVITDGLEVVREIRKEGQVASELVVGDEVEVHLKVRRVGESGYVDDCVIVDLLPAGLQIELGPQAREGLPVSNAKRLRPDYVDLREDRALVFGRIGPDVHAFAYKAKVTSPGSFAVPPPQVMSMYDLSLRGRGTSARLEVTQP